MGVIAVRAREPGDAEAIAKIMGCPGVIAGTMQLPFRSVEERRARIAQSSPDDHWLVAELDGHVVGMLGLHVQPRPRRRHCGGLGVSVHDEFAGRGVGTALMVAAIDLADNWLGLRRLELEVYTDNAAAIRLYEKFSFVREGTLRAYALRAGEYVDAYTMARVRV